MKKPFFTIITPVYNIATHLDKHIGSVKKQKYNNFEHIFIYAKSDDGTLDKIKNYIDNEKNPRVKIFKYPRKGLSAAFNKGLLHARGKYILFLNGDDFFASANALQMAHNLLKANPFCKFLQGDWAVEFADKQYRLKLSKFLYLFYHFIITYHQPTSHQNAFVHQDVFQEFGGFDEKLNTGMDTDFQLKILKEIDVYFTKENFAVYKMHKGQLSRKYSYQHLNNLKTFAIRYGIFPITSGVILMIRFWNKKKYIH